jgi:hypothetical protein
MRQVTAGGALWNYSAANEPTAMREQAGLPQWQWQRMERHADTQTAEKD